MLVVTSLLAFGCGGGGGVSQSRGNGGGSSAAEPGPNGPAGPGGEKGGDPDPSPAGATPAPKCSRAFEARTASVALFDAFKKDVAALSGAARDARVDKLFADVAAQGGTPLEDPVSGRTIFLARGAAPVGAWKVVTSLSGLDPANGIPLSDSPDTGVWFAEVSFARGASFQYRLVSGTTAVDDPLARSVVWDGVSRPLFTPGQFNAIGHPADWPKDRGRLIRHGSVHATKLANDREVFVYLPARYEDGTCATLPSVVFHDGNEALTLGDFAHAADVLYTSRPDLAAVLVFVPNAGTEGARVGEYSFGDPGSRGPDYVDFLMNDLWPSVMGGGYRLCTKPEARGLAGASLGGLISTYAELEQPGSWGWIGAQSATFSWDDNAIIARVNASPKVPARFYLDSGDDNTYDVDEMAAAMATKGYDYVRIRQPGAEHAWPYWSQRVGGMLTHFRDGKHECD